MAGRAIFKAAVSFAGVSIAVKLHTAIREQKVSFHMLHDEDAARLRQKMVCSAEQKPVERDEIVKGYEVERGRYVVMAPEELESLEPETTRQIEVDEFVDQGEIDPRFFSRPYYLGPDNSEKIFETFRRALKEQNKTAICQWTMRKKSYLGAIKPCGENLCLVSLHFSEEVIGADTISFEHKDLQQRELETAKYLIEAMSGDFQPEQYKNDYQERLMELIEKKARGERVEIGRPEGVKETESEKLLEALEASLKDVENRKKAYSGAK